MWISVDTSLCYFNASLHFWAVCIYCLMPLQSWTYRNHESMNMYLFAREQSVWESTYMLLKHKKGLLFQSIQRFYMTRPPKLFVCVFNNHLSFQYQITWHGQWYCHVVCRNSFKLPRHPSSSLTHGTGCFIGLKVVFFQNNASLSPHTYTQINTYIYCPHAHIGCCTLAASYHSWGIAF